MVSHVCPCQETFVFSGTAGFLDHFLGRLNLAAWQHAHSSLGCPGRSNASSTLQCSDSSLADAGPACPDHDGCKERKVLSDVPMDMVFLDAGRIIAAAMAKCHLQTSREAHTMPGINSSAVLFQACSACHA